MPSCQLFNTSNDKMEGGVLTPRRKHRHLEGRSQECISTLQVNSWVLEEDMPPFSIPQFLHLKKSRIWVKIIFGIPSSSKILCEIPLCM